jgi:predicted alpha/beta-fold hydrolase
MNPVSRLRPSGKISLHHSQGNKLILTRKANSQNDKEKLITLAELCRLATPSACELNPLLFNGHLQTAWTTIKNIDIPIYYRRKVFEADNPYYSGQFAVDFVVPPYEMPTSDEELDKDRKFTLDSGLPPRTSFFTEAQFAALPSDDNRPMLVVLHGLTGGSYELYLRHALAPLVLEDGGWEACVVNARGCAQTKITSGVLFNARATWDIRQTVKWLSKTFPNRPLFGIGFSLGANILTNVCTAQYIQYRRMYILLFSSGVWTPMLIPSCHAVSRRRGRELSTQSGRNLCQPMESRTYQPCSTTDVGGHGSLLQNHGREPDQTVQ